MTEPMARDRPSTTTTLNPTPSSIPNNGFDILSPLSTSKPEAIDPRAQNYRPGPIPDPLPATPPVPTETTAAFLPSTEPIVSILSLPSLEPRSARAHCIHRILPQCRPRLPPPRACHPIDPKPVIPSLIGTSYTIPIKAHDDPNQT